MVTNTQFILTLNQVQALEQHNGAVRTSQYVHVLQVQFRYFHVSSSPPPPPSLFFNCLLPLPIAALPHYRCRDAPALVGNQTETAAPNKRKSFAGPKIKKKRTLVSTGYVRLFLGSFFGAGGVFE